MSAPPTQCVWITRERTTVRHLRGLLDGLTQQGALDFGEVKIMTVSEQQGVQLSAKIMAIASADPDAVARTFTVDTLPPQGILYVGLPPD